MVLHYLPHSDLGVLLKFDFIYLEDLPMKVQYFCNNIETRNGVRFNFAQNFTIINIINKNFSTSRALFKLKLMMYRIINYLAV
jgi:hypothetical protein